MMLEKLHDHILQELQQNGRAETVFVLASLLLNIVATAVNSGVASNDEGGESAKAVFFVLIALVLTINGIAWGGLRKGQESKRKLLAGLVKLYEEQGVSQYYDKSLLTDYQSRYKMYLAGVVATGLTAVIIPVIVMVME
jgi:hypothetical protein